MPDYYPFLEPGGYSGLIRLWEILSFGKAKCIEPSYYTSKNYDEKFISGRIQGITSMAQVYILCSFRNIV